MGRTRVTWTTVKSILLKTDWQYSDPIDGEYFRFKHSSAPTSGIYQVAQAQFNPDNSVDLADAQMFEVGKQEYDNLKLAKPGHFTDRRIAIRKIGSSPSLESVLRRLLHSNLFKSEEQVASVSPSKWSADIEVSDYVTPAISSGITLDQMTEQLTPVKDKLVEISNRINSIGTSSNQTSGSSSSSSDPYFSNVVLLMPFDNDFIDIKGHGITNNGVVLSTAQSKYGGKSAYFDGNSLLTLSGGPDFNFSANNWTIEFYWLEVGSAQYATILNWDGADYPLAIYPVTSPQMLLAVGSDNNSWFVNNLLGGGLSTSDFVHHAFCRSGNNFYGFKDGVLQDTKTASNAIADSTNICIGRNGGHGIKGYLDALRITKGIARYTTSFTPLTTAFPNS